MVITLRLFVLCVSQNKQ